MGCVGTLVRGVTMQGPHAEIRNSKIVDHRCHLGQTHLRTFESSIRQ